MLLWANNGNDDPCQQDRELVTIVRVMGRLSKLGMVEMSPEGETRGHDQAGASRRLVVDNDVAGTLH